MSHSLLRHSVRKLSVSTAFLPRVFGIQESVLERDLKERVASDPLLKKIKRQDPVRVAITGAAGSIGYSLVYRLCNGELLGPDVPIDLSLLELPGAMDSLRGVCMELEDCAFPLLNSITSTSDTLEAFDGCEIALLVGSKPRSKGMERSDLLRENAHIFQSIGQAMNQVASRSCRSVVVGNPCNTNCLILAHNAPDIPRRKFTAMTRLDHDRAVSILSRKTMLPPNEVNRFCVWGNHSQNMFPDLDNCLIHGVRWEELVGYYQAERFYRNEFVPRVQQRGAEIIAARGQSSAQSAANACLAHTRDWCLGSPQPDWTSMGIFSEGSFGIPAGLVFSMPVWCKNGDYYQASPDSSWNEFQQYHIERNIQELQEERDMVAEFLPN